MPVEVTCSNCSKRYSVAESVSGKSVRCKSCGQTFIAGGSGTSETAKPAATAARTGSQALESVGRFVIRAKLGAGAFGTVYRAYDPQLDREVALKVPNPGTLSDAKRVERFLREAKAAANLRHPHIVPVFDAGKDGDTYYIASAFIEGQPLADDIPERGAEYARAARLVRELAEALAYAHEQGIVHRDVKPQNVMVDAHDRVHLMDFGLAARQDEEAKLTRDDTVMGTPAYMAPEQAKGQSADVTPAADQYAAGVVLYELLTGEVPFTGPTPVVLHNVIHADPPPVRQSRPDVPKDLETICLKALAKRPQDRYAGCQELADDLRRWQDGEPITARRLSVAERAWRWATRNKLVAGLAACVFLALSVGLSASSYFAVRAEAALDGATRDRDEADRARAAAVGSAREADRARAAAVGSAREADAQRAVAAEKAHEALKSVAEKSAALAVADSERRAAERARAVADKERAEADDARKKAVDALARVAVEEERTKWGLYLARMQLARGAWREGRTDEVLELLDRMAPKEVGDRDFRGFEWYHLRASLGGTQTAFALPKPARRRDVVGFSRDGRWLLTSDWAVGEVPGVVEVQGFEVWDCTTGKLARSIPAALFPRGWLRYARVQYQMSTSRRLNDVYSIIHPAFHPQEPKVAFFHRPCQAAGEDAREVAYLSFGLLDAKPPVPGKWPTKPLPSYIPLPHYSDDGSRLVYGWLSSDARTGAVTPAPGTTEVAQGPPEVFVADGEKPAIVPHFADKAKPAEALTKRIAELNGFALAGGWAEDVEGRYFAVRRGREGVFEVCDRVTLAAVLKLPNVPEEGTRFTLSSGNKVLALWSPDSAVVALYDTTKKAPLQTIRGHRAPVQAAAFADKGKTLVSVSQDGVVSKWPTDPVAGERTEYAIHDPYPGKGQNLTHAGIESFIASNEFVFPKAVFQAGIGKGVAPNWYLAIDPTGSVVATHVVRDSHWHLNNGLTYNQSDMIPKPSVWLSDLRTGKPVAQYRGVKVPATAVAVAFGPGGQFAVLEDHVATVWDADRGQKVFQTGSHEKAVGLRFSPAGKVLLLDEHNPRAGVVYDAATGEKLDKLTAALRLPPGDYPRDVRRVYGFGSDDGPVLGKGLANPRPGRTRGANPGHLVPVSPHPGTALPPAFTTVAGCVCAAISADGRRVATAGARDGVVVFDGVTLQEVWALKPPFPIVALEFTRDGTQLVGCDETGRLVVWGAAPKK